MMQRTRLSLLSLLVLLLCSATFVGCDSNDDDEFDEEASIEVSAMFDRLQSALAVAFNPFSVGKSEGPQEIIDCPQGGTVDVQGNTPGVSPGGFSFDLMMTFNDCNDLNGTLDYNGDGSFSSDFTQFSYDVNMNGELEAECTINYNNFGQSISTNTSTQEATVTMNGSITASCDSGSVTCSFNGVTLDLNSDSDDVFRNNCN